MELVRYTPSEWKAFSSTAHLIAFDEVMHPEDERISFALLVVDGDVPVAYATCLELSSHIVHLSTGGVMPNIKGSTKSHLTHKAVVDYLKERYEVITTRTLNTNHVMVKFCLKQGFNIIGARLFLNKLYLDYCYKKGV
jgi:hypothetical protein